MVCPEEMTMTQGALQSRLRDLGNDTWAWIAADRTWGFSNAGLIAGGSKALLVDTLFDLALTGEMLAAMRAAVPAAARIDTVVNTHANGDHCWGNQLLRGAEIIASRQSAAEMVELPPRKVAGLMKAAKVACALGPLRPPVSQLLGALGLALPADLFTAAPFVARIFAPFAFDGIELLPPTRTFDGSLQLSVGERAVELIEVGPAHTSGDIIVHVPADRVVFTGDILFVDAHPIIWAGPASSWIRACERIIDLDPAVVVPGHGPLADLGAVRRIKAYLEQISTAARRLYEQGASEADALAEIARDGFDGWSERERLAVNIATIYRELRGDKCQPNTVASFAVMARARV